MRSLLIKGVAYAAFLGISIVAANSGSNEYLAIGSYVAAVISAIVLLADVIKR